MSDTPEEPTTPDSVSGSRDNDRLSGFSTDNDANIMPPPAQRHGKEIGGPSGPEPTRYGDWERKGRCIDF